MLSSPTKAISLEPPHVHVSGGGGGEAKIWLEPEVAVAASYGFNAADLNRVLAIAREEHGALKRAWHDYFG